MNRKSRRRLHLFSLGIVLLLTSLLARAQSPDPTLLTRIDDHYNHLHTLRAHYTEHYKGMGLDRTESGTLTLKKPGLMRWSYDAPAGKVFVLDGHFAWFYTPGDAQVSRTPAKQLDDLRSPLRFLLGHTQLAKELDRITVLPEGSAGAPTAYRISGIPRGMADRVRALTLIVSPAGIIQNMNIEETSGATTDFTFTQIEENIAVPPTDFTFTPPPGATIVNAPSPI